MEGKSNFYRHLKQFDGLTWLTVTSLFYDRSTPLMITTSCLKREHSDTRVCPSVFPRSNSKRLTLCSPNLEPQGWWTLFLKAWFHNYAPSNDVPTYEQKNKKFEGAAITYDLSLWAAVSQHSLQCRVMCKHWMCVTVLANTLHITCFLIYWYLSYHNATDY